MRASTALVVVMVIGAGGCAAGVQLATPPGFVVLEPGEGAYAYRATSAEGIVVGVRVMPNEPRGDLDFWATAVDARLRRSYAAAAVEEVRSASGLAGRQMRYDVDRGGRIHRYWATVFVTDARVYLVEAAGDEAFFDPSATLVEETVLSLDAI